MTIKTLTVGDVVTAGLAYAPAALGASDTGFDFLNDGTTIIMVENGSGGSVNAVVDAQSVDGLAITDLTIAIGAGVTKAIGPFKPRYFNDSNGKVLVTISSPATTIKGQALRIPVR